MLLPPLRGPGRDAKAYPTVAELLKVKPGFTLQSCAIILASSKVSPKGGGVPKRDKTD
jgi:hypothetical protein